MIKFLAALMYILTTSDIALAAEMPSMLSGAKIPIEMIPVVLGGLRLVAEGLGIVAQKTDNKWDNKAAAGLSTVVNFLGWGIGQFGIGSPKNVKPISFSKESKPE